MCSSDLDACCLLNENRSGRSLGDECEGTVCVNSDNNGDDKADVILCSFVEFLGENRDSHAVLTECRTYGRLGSCFTCRALQFDIT